MRGDRFLAASALRKSPVIRRIGGGPPSLWKLCPGDGGTMTSRSSRRKASGGIKSPLCWCKTKFWPGDIPLSPSPWLLRQAQDRLSPIREWEFSENSLQVDYQTVVGTLNSNFCHPFEHFAANMTQNETITPE